VRSFPGRESLTDLIHRGLEKPIIDLPTNFSASSSDTLESFEFAQRPGELKATANCSSWQAQGLPSNTEGAAQLGTEQRRLNC